MKTNLHELDKDESLKAEVETVEIETMLQKC